MRCNVLNQINVLETIAYNLKSFDTQIVYGLPDDDLELMKSFYSHEVEYFTVRDQRNALFMAIGHALSSNKLGVCGIGKGPAVTNCMTGLLEAKSQCAPLLIIASGTDTVRYGSEKSFQEAQQLNLVTPLVKWSHRLENKESVEWVLKKAVYTATNGSPGPVYIEIPEDISHEMIPKKKFNLSDSVSAKPIPSPQTMEEIKSKIQTSKRPVILLGGGCKGIKDNDLMIQFAENLSAPVFVSASGRGSVDESHSLFCGLGGLYSKKSMKELVRKCDLFISLGSSLEETVLFEWEEVLKEVDTIEININEDFFNVDINSFKVIGDVEYTVKSLLNQISPTPHSRIWEEEVQEHKKGMLLEQKEITGSSNSLKVIDVLEILQTYSDSSCIFVHENGLQDIWSYFYSSFALKKNQDAIVPSEQTSLGFGCAAAIGVAKARPNTPVISFVGDGAFNIFSPELTTLVSNKIPIIYVVLRNGGYGWLEYQNNITQRQQFVDKSLPLITINHPQLSTLQVSEKSELEEQWAEALELHSKGKTVVFEVNVDLNDVPVELAEVYGGFPEKVVES